MTPGFYPAFSFVPRFTSRNMEICRRKWVQSLWENLMSSCHLERTEKTGVGCLDISLHSPGKGRKRGAWARMLPRPHSPHTAAHKGKQGLFSLHSGRWCSLCQRCRNSALGGTRISSLCHSALGPQKWVRASARNCGWRIAGRDACLAQAGEDFLMEKPIAVIGKNVIGSIAYNTSFYDLFPDLEQTDGGESVPLWPGQLLRIKDCSSTMK